MSSGIILAGGESSRMGAPKALLPFDGEPLIVHIARKLHKHFPAVLVVAAPGQDLPAMPARTVHDAVAHQGPVGGIFYGLQAAQSELVFVTSCDAPFGKISLADFLLGRADGFDAVVPEWEGRLHPLFAVYRSSVRSILQSQLARGELRLVDLFDKVKTRIVEADEIRRFDPAGASFFNINAPADYEAAIARWPEET